MDVDTRVFIILSYGHLDSVEISPSRAVTLNLRDIRPHFPSATSIKAMEDLPDSIAVLGDVNINCEILM